MQPSSKIMHRLGVALPEETAMDNLTFGLTMLVVGMGGTLVALSLLALLMGLLKKVFPIKEESSN
jgi:Na+-transporting methylmalonyl-CoA/oxaloacetate decarboxylase gamma subunit